LSKDGSKPTVKMILNFKSVYCFEGLSYLGSVSRGWHDSLSGTYVVKKERLATSIRFFNNPEEFGKAE
jgi:hypothetical protein